MLFTRGIAGLTSDDDVSEQSRVKDEESEIEGLGLVHINFSKDIVRPVFVYPCPLHPTSPCDEELQLCDESAPRIRITVGTEPRRRVFSIHKLLLCHHSDYFKGAFRAGPLRFVEAETGEFEWPEDDPEEFHLWVNWLYSCTACQGWPKYDPNHQCIQEPEEGGSRSSWCMAEPEQAFTFGDRILSSTYCMAALASFIQHVHLADFSRLGWTYEITSEGSGLHRFVRHWIAWLKFRGYDKTPADELEYPTLFSGIEGWTSLDPRKYKLRHWLQDCSKQLYIRCEHSRHRPAYLIRPKRLDHMVHPVVREPRRTVPAWMLCLWYATVIGMMIIAPYIFAGDAKGLIAKPAKILSIVTACLAFIGAVSRGLTRPLLCILMVFLAFASAIFSAYQAGKCFKNHGTRKLICNLEMGFTSLEFFYVVLLVTVISNWRLNPVIYH